MHSPIASPPPTLTAAEVLAVALERVTPLQGLEFEDRLWLAQHGEEIVAEAGDVLFEETTAADRMILILKGEIHVHRPHHGNIPVFIGRTGQMTGLLPFSRMKTFGGHGVAATKVWALMIPKPLFADMLEAIPSMGQRCVSTLLDRVREVTRIEQQAEKLTALGKLAGNLAHELNNPASAAQRAASGLVTELRANRENRFKLVNLCLTEEQALAVGEWERTVFERKPAEAAPDAAEQIRREETLRKWLTALPCPDPWDLAPNLAEHGISVDDLEDLRKILDVTGTCVTLQYFARYLRSTRSVETLIASTARIFDLISAIKTYSNMDRAAILDVDVPEGLDATVQMLQSRMRNVLVERDYQANLPCISAYGAELNQVWTALIENALDAMACLDRPRKLRLLCRLEGEMLLVEIQDNGPGIAPELQDRVFEPFFTTKPPGHALGLGLDHATRVVRKHRGYLDVRSEPGNTRFRVRLPMNQFEAY
jgi:signal transduction histidine kinase